ncbi:MAG: ribonuclease P protein component [Actinomycetota bacterium]|nr:ribonuclease P protein component [Actinomycetota bacterium]
MRSSLKRKDWESLAARGLMGRRDGLRLRALRIAPNDAFTMIGVVARGPAGAVERNLIRRRIRAAFRELGPPQGWKIGVWADREAGELGFQELVEALRDALADAEARLK